PEPGHLLPERRALLRVGFERCTRYRRRAVRLEEAAGRDAEGLVLLADPDGHRYTTFSPSWMIVMAWVGHPCPAATILSSGSPRGSITIATPSSSRSNVAGAQNEQLPEPMQSSRSSLLSSVMTSGAYAGRPLSPRGRGTARSARRRPRPRRGRA